ncbi:hypothetical protein SNK04_005426 [Fusarium graminearum]
MLQPDHRMTDSLEIATLGLDHHQLDRRIKHGRLDVGPEDFDAWRSAIILAVVKVWF